MDFFSGGDSKKGDQPGLFSSAKLVADAAKSSFSGESAAVDKGKVAGAAADLLGAASDYGKLDETKGVGKYVDQAENYLHEFQKSHSGGAPAPAPKVEEPAKAAEPEKKDPADAGSGLLKMAEGFLK